MTRLPAVAGSLSLLTGWLCLALAGMTPCCGQESHSKTLDGYFSRGQLEEADQHFRTICTGTPGDHGARFALGLTEFLQAIESLGQANHRFGLMSHQAQWLPMARLPVPENPTPEKVRYEDLRDVVASFAENLKRTEATLAAVDSTAVRLDFYLGRVRLDLNGDGAHGEQETLWRIFAEVNRGVEAEQGEGFFVGLDGADVHWLRGYCHVLMAFCDMILAYDERELFERCGQLLFPEIDSPWRTARELADGDEHQLNQITDAIAAIHLIRFPLVEPERMKSAHAHLLQVVAESRKCWDRASAETDNDHEWIPNPDQDSVLQQRVSAEIITGWSAVLDELEALLEGRKLVPFWRTYPGNLPLLGGWFAQADVPANGTGINLRRFFHEPREFDLILTLQGTAVEPWLEEGPLSTPESWEQLTRVFQGQFFGFAVWFN